jgi:hypothetical protein
MHGWGVDLEAEARGAEDGVDKPKGVESTEENALAW